jgi:hypothetical protein
MENIEKIRLCYVRETDLPFEDRRGIFDPRYVLWLEKKAAAEDGAKNCFDPKRELSPREVVKLMEEKFTLTVPCKKCGELMELQWVCENCGERETI